MTHDFHLRVDHGAEHWLCRGCGRRLKSIAEGESCAPPQALTPHPAVLPAFLMRDP